MRASPPIHEAIFLMILTMGQAVPPRTPDDLQEQLVDIKVTLASVTTQLDKFNSHYLSKLENRMMAAATVLSSLEAKLNHVLERSHAWDTFQLHVTSWNDQMHTINNKMDILSRGQEEQAQLEARLAVLPAMDYKLERLGLRLEDVDRRIIALAKEKDAQRDNPIVGEFAARGVLATLKVIERKIDRLSQNPDRGNGRRFSSKADVSAESGRGNAASLRSPGSVETVSNISAINAATAAATSESSGRIVIRCQAPRAMDELLRDVAAKVDYMFDRSQGRRPPEGESAEESGDGEMKEEDDREISQSMPRHYQAVVDDSNSTRAFLELTAAVKELKSSPSFPSVAADLERMIRNLSSQTARRAEVVASFCKEQRAHLEAALDARLNAHSLRYMLMGPGPAALSVATPVPACAGGRDEQCSSFQTLIFNSTQGSPLSTSSATQNATAKSVEPAPPSEFVLPLSATAVPTTTTTNTVKASGPNSCEDLAGPNAHSGVFKLNVEAWEGHGDRDFGERFCDMRTAGGGWTVIQRRGDLGEPHENFTRSWEEYRDGFGDLQREFWFGNDFIHRLTYDRPVTLRIDLEDFEGNTAWAEYNGFRVGSESQQYELSLGEYSGNASDSLSTHHGAAFSTVDRNHDSSPPCCPCAQTYGGGWWFRSCFNANLNGVYHTSPEENGYFRGIIWERWLGDYSLRSASMKIRSADYKVSFNETR